MYPSLLLKKTISIWPFSSLHITLLGRFLIRGKLYFETLTFIVVIFPISRESSFFILEGNGSKSFITKVGIGLLTVVSYSSKATFIIGL